MENSNTEHILNSLDSLQKASPGPFFYTRVQARLQKEKTGVWGSLASYFTRPAVALVTLGLIFLLNAAAFFYERQTTGLSDQTEQTVNEEYNTTLAVNSYYDENNDPR